MPQDTAYSSDVAFTSSVKEVQRRRGSRNAYERMEAAGSWETRITQPLADFIATQTSLFLATASAEGQPYVQHRGGPAGFLRILDEKTLGFADFAGNRQYISVEAADVDAALAERDKRIAELEAALHRATRGH